MLKERNKQIIKQHEEGKSIMSLSREYKLTNARIRQIVTKQNYMTSKERKDIFKRFDYKCQWRHTCRQRDVGMFDLRIYYIDGDKNNTDEENITIACENCIEEYNRQMNL